MRNETLSSENGGMLVEFKCDMDFSRIKWCEVSGINRVSIRIIQVYVIYSDLITILRKRRHLLVIYLREKLLLLGNLIFVLEWCWTRCGDGVNDMGTDADLAGVKKVITLPGANTQKKLQI